MTAEDRFWQQLRRLDKEESYAKPAYKYGNPERNASFGKRTEGGEVDRLSDREIADNLLMEWYRWTKQWRPKLGAPRVAPYCQQATSNKQYDDPADLTHDKVYQNEMAAVDFCVDAIEVSMQQAIGTEMRNREVKRQVWRSPSNKTYTEALMVILPVMKKRGLFD